MKKGYDPYDSGLLAKKQFKKKKDLRKLSHLDPEPQAQRGLTGSGRTRRLARMSGLVLVIGTKNYSSWSLRPWLLLKHLDLEFTERQYHFGTPEFEAKFPRSPRRAGYRAVAR